MKNIISKLGKWARGIATGNSMRNTLTRLTIYHVLAFAWLWFTYPDISVLPLGGLCGLSAVRIFYTIDSRGFDEINTIALFERYPSMYHDHLKFYWGLILAGYIFAWIAIR